MSDASMPARAEIVLVGSFPPPHGGQAVHIAQLFRYVKQHGFAAVTLNTGANKNIDAEGVRNVASARELLAALVFEGSPALVHAHASSPAEFGKLVPVWAAAMVKGYKCVLTIHSGNVDALLAGVAGLRRSLVRLILRRMDRIVCVNETTAKLLSGWTPPGRLVIIPAYSFGVADARPDERIERHLNTHSPVISCAGFFRELYGFDLAIRAVARLKARYPAIGLLVMGDPAGSAPYQTLISAEGVGDHVLLCGNIEHDVCLSIMRRSALFLRPTYYDGDSISVREALALGTPVVASDTEFRPPGVTLFRKGDLQDLVEKIDAALSEPRRSAIPPGGAGRDTANLDAILRVYSDLLA